MHVRLNAYVYSNHHAMYKYSSSNNITFPRKDNAEPANTSRVSLVSNAIHLCISDTAKNNEVMTVSGFIHGFSLAVRLPW